MAWIPEPIYKTLPAAYALVGVALLATFGARGPAALSALALLLAAALTALWRHQHRDDAPQADKPSPQRQAWEARRAKREAQSMGQTKG